MISVIFKKYHFLFFYTFLLFLINCGKDEPTRPSESQNHKPVIISVSASPAEIGKNQTSTLSLIASDEDGDDLQYEWTTEAGSFLQGNDRKFAVWKVPNSLGNFHCQVTVSDGKDDTTGIINVGVIEVALLNLSTDSLDFNYGLDTKTFFISNVGKVDLVWEAIPSKSCITVNPSNGTTSNETDEITVTIDRNGLPAGDHIGIVSVRSNGGNKDILVSLTVLITPQMVLIPAGEFTMGSDLGNQDEQPIHQVYLEDYWIDKYEVTNQQYVEFLNELNVNGELVIRDAYRGKAVFKSGLKIIQFYDGYLFERGVDCPINFVDGNFITERGTENQSVRFVTWYGALAYSKHYGKRLPTEAEWEKAARGTSANVYPWGNLEPTQWYCNYNDRIGYPTMVGHYSPLGDSPFGCCDMAGNVWEWCSSLYKEYPYRADDGREDLTASGYRVVRGGGWGTPVGTLRCALRNYNEPSFNHPGFGFRCVK